MFALLQTGGFAMWPLVLCSVIMVAVVIDRAVYLLQARCAREDLLDEVTRSYRGGGIDEAAAAAAGYRGPVARVVRQVLATAGTARPVDWRAGAERAKAIQQALLERRLYVLGSIGAVAPFIGLFGTVLGIQRAFAEIAKQGNAGIGVVGAGVSEALVATAAGLGIAIVAVVAYNILNNLVDQVALEMDLAADEVLGILEAPAAALPPLDLAEGAE
ncbi:MAG: MotA/TolQ/ExbB proton channel family protein [Armatimonadetes bacterium]|nr:MotA/TolQ/ExbB proton channel family protein [Armatimonadota bacterium]